MALAIGGLMATSGFYFMRYRTARLQRADLQSQNAELTKQLSAFKTNPEQANKAETDKIIAEIGKSYALPKEPPTSVYTVKDKVAAQKEPFFSKAEQDDVALIYTNSKLAILYRPSTKQIINVSTVTIQDKPAATPTIP